MEQQVQEKEREESFSNKSVNGPGRRFLDGNFEQLAFKTRVSEIDSDLGATIAINLIEATSKTTDIIKPPTGIGGGVDCILLALENKVFK